MNGKKSINFVFYVRNGFKFRSEKNDDITRCESSFFSWVFFSFVFLVLKIFTSSTLAQSNLNSGDRLTNILNDVSAGLSFLYDTVGYRDVPAPLNFNWNKSRNFKVTVVEDKKRIA